MDFTTRHATESDPVRTFMVSDDSGWTFLRYSGPGLTLEGVLDRLRAELASWAEPDDWEPDDAWVVREVSDPIVVLRLATGAVEFPPPACAAAGFQGGAFHGFEPYAAPALPKNNPREDWRKAARPPRRRRRRLPRKGLYRLHPGR